MKTFLKISAALTVMITALLITPLTASAASFGIENKTVVLSAGQTVDIPVITDAELKVRSECASVAKGVYDSSRSCITVTAKDFGEVRLLVYNAKNTKDKDYITVRSAAAAASGKFTYLGRYYQRFKLSSGGYAKGWRSINGDTYYFYPNGIAETYTGPIMSKNKLYFLENGKFNGEIYDAYIFEVLNNNMPVPDDCAEFYSQACGRYGAENVKKRWTDAGSIAITVQSYMPGFPWGAKGTYYFTGETSEEPVGEPAELSGFTFDNYATYSLTGYTDSMYKSTMKSLYVRKALFDAFGTNCKGYVKKDGSKVFRWKNVGKERAVVDVSLKSDRVDFEIYVK